MKYFLRLRHCEPSPERSEGAGEAIQCVGFTPISELLRLRLATTSLFPGLLRNYFVSKAFLLLLVFPLLAMAMPKNPIRLEKVDVNLQNKASIQRGAKFYAQNCMVCHSMKYLQHNKIAEEAGITLDKMPLENQKWWLNIVPPDLTLIAVQKGPKWLYTYFHSFYKDPKRPTGYNNLLVKDVNMTNIFLAYQGEQVLTEKGELVLQANGYSRPHYYSLLKLVKAGTMTPGEFDRTMTDLVNFLVYASDPGSVHRERLGIWVLLFLAVLFVLAYLLKKAYWKDVK